MPYVKSFTPSVLNPVGVASADVDTEGVAREGVVPHRMRVEARKIPLHHRVARTDRMRDGGQTRQRYIRSQRRKAWLVPQQSDEEST